MISETEIAWLAGLLEGEGYFSLRKARKIKSTGEERWDPTIVLVMSDLDIVERCARMWGTHASELKKREEHHLPSYRCTLRGSGAIHWMKRIYPYMGARRREKIKEIIEQWETMPLYKKPILRRNRPEGFLKDLAVFDPALIAGEF